MIGRADFLAALILATAGHLALFDALSTSSGVASNGGDNGRSAISIQAATPEIRAMIARWEESPAVPVQVISQPVPSEETASKVVESWEDRSAPTKIPSKLAEADASRSPVVQMVRLETLKFEAPDVVSPPALQNSAQKQIKMPAPGKPDPSNNDPLPGLTEISPPEIPDRAIQQANRPKLRPSRATVTRRKAEGIGNAPVRGTGSATTNPAIGEDARRAAKALWAAAIQRRIARFQDYPRGARGGGRVRLAMIIGANGDLREVRVAASSGLARFDEAAVRAAKRAAPFPAAPDGLTESWFNVGQWVSFQR